MPRALRLTVLALLLTAGARLAAGDPWQDRVETLLRKVEAAVARLDARTAPKVSIAKRLLDLDWRVAALEERAQRPRKTVSVLETGTRDELLSSWTAAAVALEGRVQALSTPEAPASPPPAAPPPTPPAAPPPPAARPPATFPVEREYDRFDDTTTLRVNVPLGDGELKVAIFTVVPGRSPSGPRGAPCKRAVAWLFSASHPTWKYLRYHPLRLLSEPGARRFEAQGKHDGRVGRGYVLEFVSFQQDLETFLALTRSTSLEGRLGTTEFRFPPAALRSLALLGEELQQWCPPAAEPGPAPEGTAERPSPRSTGSGFLVSADGYVVTNHHVTAAGSQLEVVTRTGRHAAKLVAADAANDLAVLKIEGAFPALPVAPSRSVRLGATVATVGFPNPELQGFSPKLAKGEVAGLAGVQDDPRHFQISVPVQPGNSGGPLVDERGNVVGVVAAKLSERAARASSGAAPENVGYAVKSTLLLSLLESVPGLAERLPPTETGLLPFEDLVKRIEAAAVLIAVR